MGVIHKTVEEDIHIVVFDADFVDIKNVDVVKTFVKVEQEWVEATLYSLLQATETNHLADQKRRMRRCPAPTGMVTTLANIG